VNLRCVTNSIIHLGNVEGPVYMDHVEHSTLIINCHQFRIHQSHNVNALVSCTSKRPIIENCSDMRFSQYPISLQSDGISSCEWTAVDDFNWIRKEHSTNWKKAIDTSDWTWLLNQTPSTQSGDLDDILRRNYSHSTTSAG
jgi:hypothetical protein